MQALSQLSYGPAEPRQCSSELKFACPPDAGRLVVAGRRKPQLHGSAPDGELVWKEVALLRVRQYAATASISSEA